MAVVVVSRRIFVTLFDRCGDCRGLRAVSLVGACWGVEVEEVGPVMGGIGTELCQTGSVVAGG